MTSTNWRPSQSPLSGDVAKLDQKLNSLSLTDARRNRSGTVSGQIPTIQVSNTITPKRTIQFAGDILGNLGSGLPPTASARLQGRNPGSTARPAGSGAYTLYNRPGTSGGAGNTQLPVKLSKHDFKVGTILRAALHEEDFNGTSGAADVTVASKFVSKSFAGPVFTKIRVMIVVACHRNHYIAVPLFTHNGNGLSRKHPAEKTEYVSVKDHRFKGQLTPQSAHGFLETEFLRPGIYMINPLSAAHITYALPRKHDLPIIIQGFLNKESATNLVQLYTELALKKDALLHT